jgi:hypothetical protein
MTAEELKGGAVVDGGKATNFKGKSSKLRPFSKKVSSPTATRAVAPQSCMRLLVVRGCDPGHIYLPSHRIRRGSSLLTRETKMRMHSGRLLGAIQRVLKMTGRGNGRGSTKMATARRR